MCIRDRLLLEIVETGLQATKVSRSLITTSHGDTCRENLPHYKLSIKVYITWTELPRQRLRRYTWPVVYLSVVRCQHSYADVNPLMPGIFLLGRGGWRDGSKPSLENVSNNERYPNYIQFQSSPHPLGKRRVKRT